MDAYELISREVNQRLRLAENWKSKGVKSSAEENIDAAYGAIKEFEVKRYEELVDSSITEFLKRREKIREFARTLRIKLGKTLDEIAEME